MHTRRRCLLASLKAGRQAGRASPTPNPPHTHTRLPRLHQAAAAAAPPSGGSRQAPGQIVQRLQGLCLVIHFKSVSRQPVERHYASKKKKKKCSRSAPPISRRSSRPSSHSAAGAVHIAARKRAAFTDKEAAKAKQNRTLTFWHTSLSIPVESH